MRGREDRSESPFSYVRLEERVPSDHPLRPIWVLADEVLAGLNGRFETLYSAMGRPSIPPEMLMRATLLQAFFSVRSGGMLMEQIDYDRSFRGSTHRRSERVAREERQSGRFGLKVLVCRGEDS